MRACGIYLANRRLHAVVVDDDGRALPAVSAPLTDDARWGLLTHVEATHGLDCDVVIPDLLARLDPIGQLATAREAAVWLAPQRLLDALWAVSGCNSPARAAALVARLATVHAFRGYLRRPGTDDDRQLPLF